MKHLTPLQKKTLLAMENQDLYISHHDSWETAMKEYVCDNSTIRELTENNLVERGITFAALTEKGRQVVRDIEAGLI